MAELDLFRPAVHTTWAELLMAVQEVVAEEATTEAEREALMVATIRDLERHAVQDRDRAAA